MKLVLSPELVSAIKARYPTKSVEESIYFVFGLPFKPKTRSHIKKNLRALGIGNVVSASLHEIDYINKYIKTLSATHQFDARVINDNYIVRRIM